MTGMGTLAFDKYQALGNDFIVIDGRTRRLDITPAQIARFADRRRGIGCDQLLIARPHTDASLEMQVFNQDGSTAEQCGNGLRCLAGYAFRRGWVSGDTAAIYAGGAVRSITRAGEHFIAEMGSPEWRDEHIPFKPDAFQTPEPIQVVGALGFPNPHLVLAVPSAADAPVAEIGAYYQQSQAFPRQVNVGFMQVVDDSRIRLRVYERGAGETPGCGSGACAAVAAGQREGMLGGKVTVQLPGGELIVTAADQGFTQQGPAEYVFSGRLPFPLPAEPAA